MQDWELVVADDGSGRDVRDYLETLDDGGRVRTLWLPHSGNPGRARNAAIAVARAPYIAFLDSDDLWGTRDGDRCVARPISEEHTSELQSQSNLVCRLLIEKKHIV